MAMAFLRAGAIASSLPPSVETCTAFAATGTIFASIHLDRWADECIARALEIAGQLDSPYATADANQYAGHVEFFRARWDAAMLRLRAAREGYLQCGDLLQLAVSNAGLFYSLYYQGRIREALEATDEIIPELDYTGATQFGKSHFYMRSRALSRLGRHEEALESVQKALRLSVQADDLTCICKSEMEYGDCLLTAGRLDEAIAFLERARRTRERHLLVLDHVFRVYPLLARAYLERIRADADRGPAREHPLWRQAVRNVRKAERMTRRHPNYQTLALLDLGVMHALAGDRDSALARLQEGLGLAVRRGSVLDLALLEAETARLLEATDPAASRRLLAEARARLARCEAVGLLERLPEVAAVPGAAEDGR
jgi:tetratricopeptide (TPR) repeat protein